MKDLIEAAVKKLTEKAEKAEKSDDALKYTQAALNVAHAFCTLEGIKR